MEEHHFPETGEVSRPPRLHHAITCQLGDPKHIFRRCGGRSDDRLFAPGDFGLCPAGESTYAQWPNQAHILQILLPAQWVTDICVRMEGAKATGELRVSFGDTSAQVTWVALALQAELKGGCPSGPLYAETLAMAMAVFLLRSYGAAPLKLKEYARGLGKSDLALVLTYIEDHLADSVSLTELAACAHVSMFHFIRLFKQSTGLTPHRYVTQQRVEKAKTLLISGQLTVGEIAQAVGFFDHSNLYFHFKRLTGLSPSEFSRR